LELQNQLQYGSRIHVVSEEKRLSRGKISDDHARVQAGAAFLLVPHG
jgi:hypothetical protein